MKSQVRHNLSSGRTSAAFGPVDRKGQKFTQQLALIDSGTTKALYLRCESGVDKDELCDYF